MKYYITRQGKIISSAEKDPYQQTVKVFSSKARATNYLLYRSKVRIALLNVITKSRLVRFLYLHQKHNYNDFIYDMDWRVREATARKGIGVKELAEDIDWRVRREVARQGYCLDTLKDDTSFYVSVVANEQIVNGNNKRRERKKVTKQN